MKKNILLTALALPLIAIGQTSNYCGVWILKEKEVIHGPDYANGLPYQIKVSQSKEHMIFEVKALTVQGKDTIYTELVDLHGKVTESNTNNQRKKEIHIALSKSDDMLKRSIVLSEKGNYAKPEIRITEDWITSQISGNYWLLIEKSVTSNKPNDMWSMKGKYEKMNSNYKTSDFSNVHGIRFEEEVFWSDVVKIAKEQKKYIFVDCYATWCSPCRKMDLEVYPFYKVGEFANDKFISIRVQMDTSYHDNQYIRRWYDDAARIQKECKVNVFPTYLFFNPDGKLIHRDVGYKKIDEFINLLHDAVDSNKQYYSSLERYKLGERNYLNMVHLAILANKLGDKEFARTIAEDVKFNFLDKLNQEDIIKEKNLFVFIGQFPDLVSSRDIFFSLFLKHNPVVDSVLGQGTSDWFLKRVIKKEIVNPYLYKDTIKGKYSIVRNPNWMELWKKIQVRYNEIYADDIIKDAKVRFYIQEHDGPSYVNLMARIVKAYPPKDSNSRFSRTIGGITAQMPDHMTLNNIAWTVYLTFNDRYSLEVALSWSDMSIISEPSNVMYLDTKARLLYKLGRSSEAIAIMENVVAQSLDDNEYLQVLRKMRSSSKNL